MPQSLLDESLSNLLSNHRRAGYRTSNSGTLLQAWSVPSIAAESLTSSADCGSQAGGADRWVAAFNVLFLHDCLASTNQPFNQSYNQPQHEIGEEQYHDQCR